MDNESSSNIASANPFFDHPILNSPYECPPRHWELDQTGQPTQKIIEQRRSARFITPIPKPKKRKAAAPRPANTRRNNNTFSAEDEAEVTGGIAFMFVGAFSAPANSKG